MKIAVASMKDIISDHFGHCENFNIYEADNGNIKAHDKISNPGHKPGFLPNFLADRGVNVIIAGNMGGGAVEIFHERGIEVIVGASGTAENAVKDYLAGNLKSTDSVCHEHAHEDECGRHTM